MRKIILSLIAVMVISGVVSAQRLGHEHRGNRERASQPRVEQQRRAQPQRRVEAQRVQIRQPIRIDPRERDRNRGSYERERNRQRARVVVRMPRFRIYFPRLYFRYHFDRYDVAERQGYNDGRYAGEDDAINGRSYNPEGSSYYINSTRFQFSTGYRAGFYRGYREGYYQ